MARIYFVGSADTLLLRYYLLLITSKPQRGFCPLIAAHLKGMGRREVKMFEAVINFITTLNIGISYIVIKLILYKRD